MAQAIEAELQQINDAKTFRVLEENEPIPPGYKVVPYHCVYMMSNLMEDKSAI
jgi:hypothetical protein